MKALLALVLLTLPACTTIKVYSDGSCEAETVRKITLQCGGSVIATGEVALNQESAQALIETAGEVIK